MTDSTTERPPKRRGPTYDRKVIRRAKEMRRYGDSYRVIAATLGVPATTVQYWTQDTIPDNSGRWTMTEAATLTEPDPAVVVTELGAVILSSGGRVTGMTRNEARWVTLLANVRPDILESGPGSTWQLAREFIEAVKVGDEAELRRLEQRVATGAARVRWPQHEAKVARLREKSEQVAQALKAGANPFLDGWPYGPEETSDETTG